MNMSHFLVMWEIEVIANTKIQAMETIKNQVMVTTMIQDMNSMSKILDMEANKKNITIQDLEVIMKNTMNLCIMKLFSMNNTAK